MVMMEKTSKWWWFDSHNSSKRSPWLHSTLSELDAKTKAMLKLIEEDADSFAQRAEMYYKKRPELISMVEDFYRTHRSLAERHDLVRSSDLGTRLVATLASPFSSLNRHVYEKSTFSPYQKYNESCLETYEIEEYPESEVDDPEDEHDEVSAEGEKDSEGDDGSAIDEEREDEEVSGLNRIHRVEDEVAVKMREELERLREENRVMNEQLRQKDEEKREVIRQLSLAVEVLKEENSKLKKCVSVAAAKEKEESPKKQWSPFEFKKLKEGFLGKLVTRSPQTKPRVLTF